MRLTPLAPGDEPGEAAPVLAEILAQRGWVPSLYRTLARSPGLLGSFVDMTAALKTETSLPAGFREFAILVVAHELEAGIQWAAHVPLALDAGVSAASTRALTAPDDLALSSELMAVRDFALEVTKDGEPADNTWAALGRFLDERQLLELTLTVGFYNMVARFLRTAGLPVDLEYGSPPG